ncbi:dihydroneopterin triphosphate pyrophosphatase [Yersinia pseudotuberculosis]|nr:dihydroneopterin triphosphate pyrophosphatase [Yersinia pseudotuberculosis]SUP85891.1 dihydroneopterin triphosphate pyrophosphatase [Yersinia pseudotuberculosis]
MNYKRPESVLVVIYAKSSGRVLMLQRRDDPDFWQSVTGSLEEGEAPLQTAQREVKEEVGIDILGENLVLLDCQRCVEFSLNSLRICAVAMLRELRVTKNIGSVWRCRRSGIS